MRDEAVESFMDRCKFYAKLMPQETVDTRVKDFMLGIKLEAVRHFESFNIDVGDETPNDFDGVVLKVKIT